MGLLFVAASVLGAMLIASSNTPEFAEASLFRLCRTLVYYLASVYALKMAAVFMMTASMMILRTGFTARWTALLGVTMAIAILIGAQAFDWMLFLLPLWVLCVSLTILYEDLLRAGAGYKPGQLDLY